MKSKNLIKSFKYAFEGLFTSLKTERNLKIHVSIMILVIICGVILKINIWEWLICVLCFGAVISAELFNTAIEATVNIASPEKNALAKLAKDVSASAVLVLAITSSIVGLIIFIPKIVSLIR